MNAAVAHPRSGAVDAVPSRDHAGLALASEVARARARLATHLGQQVRTPATTILSLGGALQHTKLDGVQCEYVEKILAAAHQLIGSMDAVMELSRIESGRLQLNVRDFSLKAVLDRAHSLAEAACQRQAAVLRVVVASSVRDRISGDPARVCQILSNYADTLGRLVRPGAAITLSVSVAHRAQDEVVLRFGVGVRADVLLAAPPGDELFADPSQLDSGLRPNSGAASLALCRRLARLLGGDAGTDRHADGDFEIWFSARFREAPTEGTEVAIFADPPPVLGGKRVLVMEDDRLQAGLIRELLELAGVRVNVATHGKEAVELLGREAFDAVLMNMLKPVLKGREVAVCIRQQQRLAHLPIIVCAAKAQERDKAACTAAGADDFISQPVDPSKLWATVAHWVQAGRVGASRAGPRDDFYQVTVPGSL